MFLTASRNIESSFLNLSPFLAATALRVGKPNVHVGQVEIGPEHSDPAGEIRLLRGHNLFLRLHYLRVRDDERIIECRTARRIKTP